VTIESSLSDISVSILVQTMWCIAADVPAGWESMEKHKMMIDENRRERLQCLESRIRDNR
jgi:hypothetical protein